MRYLISGSHGFIGSRYGTLLLERGEVVRAIPRDLLLEKWNLKRYIQSEQPDFIIHLASYGNHSTQRDIEKTIEANIICTTNLFEACRDSSVRAVINTSTSSVGLDRQTMYSATKRGGEEIARHYAQEYNLPIVSVRPFSVYGVGEANFRFIPTIIRAAKYGGDLSIVEEPKHDWIYIDDFIQGVEKTIQNADKLRGGYIEIGTGKQYSNKDVFEAIQRIHSSKIPHKRAISMRVYDTKEWSECDTTPLEAMGWKQEYSLGHGLELTYESY